MSGFDENIVREYFELNGFFVRQLRKYQVQSRKKRFDEEIDMLVYNPKASNEKNVDKINRSSSFQLFANDIGRVHQAVVVVKAWHSSKFTPAILRSGTKFFDFLKKDVLKKASDSFNFNEMDESDCTSAIQKILIIPSLPSNEPHRSESISLLKEQGIDGIISFATILEGIINSIQMNNSYQKSDLLQLIRILKIYDMIKEPQMTFFD